MVLLLPRCAREMDVFPEISFLLLIILYELVGRVFFSLWSVLWIWGLQNHDCATSFRGLGVHPQIFGTLFLEMTYLLNFKLLFLVTGFLACYFSCTSKAVC